jgi:type IV secretion system protein VirB5
MQTRRQCAVVSALLALVMVPVAHAQWAVIDVAAVTRLTTEIQTLEQSLATERQQYLETQQMLSSMTGARGMHNLLAGVRRNYLPENWAQLRAALAGDSSAYPQLAAAIASAVRTETILTPAEFARLTPAAQAQVTADRRTAALLQALSSAALANASGRFAQLQQLISAIGSAQDQKAILDLTARIDAEQTMVQNEQTKLRVLFAAAEAQHWTDRQRAREAAIAAQGEFATRFQPTP